MTLTFLGTGTSTGIPMVGCGCDVCRSDDPRNHRRRASVLFRSEDHTWLVDAGPDFRVQALDARLQRLDGVFLTHAHADHVLGLDDLRPLSWIEPIPVWADQKTTATVRRAFPYFFEAGDGKTSRPRLEFRELREYEPLPEMEGEFLPVPIRHGDGDILGFRWGQLAYLTDCNGLSPQAIEALAGLDTVILGALRYRPHPTHFSVDEAVEMGRLLGARATYLTHFSHEIDHSTLGGQLPAGFAPAYDGLVVPFSPYRTR